MPILNGLSTDYGNDNGALIVSSTITKGVYAVSDVDMLHNPVDLQLGTNGSINFVVGGGNDVEGVNEHLALKSTVKYDIPVFNFEVEGGSKPIALTPRDANSTVYIGDAVVWSDATTVKLGAMQKKLELDMSELKLAGPVHSGSDLKVDGNMFTTEININKSAMGYAFRINDSDVLELIKYNTESNHAQLVANFGTGFLMNTMDYQYNEYLGGNTTVVTDPVTGEPVATDTYWKPNGNNIYFSGTGSVHRVGINTSNPSYELDVHGTIGGTVLTDGVLQVENGYITGAHGIGVSNVLFHDANDGSRVFDGTVATLQGLGQTPLSFFANDLQISDFSSGAGDVWYDTAQNTIKLTDFNNDLIDINGTAQLTNISASGSVDAQQMNAQQSITVGPNTSGATTQITPISMTTNTVNADAVSATNATISQQLNADSINIVSSATVEGTLSIGGACTASAIAANAVTTDTMLANQKVTALDMEALNTLIANQVQASLAQFTNLTTAQLNVTGNVTSHLIPDADVTYDLGGANTNRWRDLYLSGDTLVIGNTTLKGHTQEVVTEEGGTTHTQTLAIQGDMAADTVVFGDGTRLASTKEIGLALGAGEEMGYFTTYKITINLANEMVTSLMGKYNYDENHDGGFQNSNRWRVYYFSSNTMVPIDTDGYVSSKKGRVLRSDKSPDNVALYLDTYLNKGKKVGDMIFFTQQMNDMPVNQMHQLSTLDPYSEMFKIKMTADFFDTFNYKQTLQGYQTSGASIHMHDGVRYCRMIGFEQFAANVGQTDGLYEVELMYAFNSPLFQDSYLNANIGDENTQIQRYLIPTDPLMRATTVYKYNFVTLSYDLIEVHTDFGLFPSIGLFEWHNTANHSKFTDAVYADYMGWGLEPHVQQIYLKYNRNDASGTNWLKELFRLTYLYIRYGTMHVKADDDPNIINLDLLFEDRVGMNNIRFINTYHPNALMETSLDTNTRIVLSKDTFDGLY